MPKSFRIKTDIGVNKTIPVNLEQQFDTLEILSLAIFPNDVYPRRCANFGVLCGRVFANRGFGIPNARISVFIPLDSVDEEDPIISVLYPYKRIEDFNEDGYKYNLLPYTQSHSGHVPVGTFPDRNDALTNKSVIEVYDKYYKYTTKTNESGDYMIFGLPVGQHSIFMQVDLSDIGEFSLTPQDLIRMGLATETQIDGVKFKFSENYSELPQIITIQKNIQVAPFYGEKDVCDHYIVRTDFDLTSESGVEFKPTAVFMGSIISHSNRKKIKRKCKVPAKAGWLCDLITGPGQIESIRQTIFNDEFGRPILEEFILENSGKVIDENGAWVLEVPMNLDYVYTDEDGKKVLSNDPSLGVPTRGKYRFKVKWSQSPRVGEENKRGYFLVPNVKEWGWEDSGSENRFLSSPSSSNWINTSPTKAISDTSVIYPPTNVDTPVIETLPFGLSSYFAVGFISAQNVSFFRVLVNDGTDNYVEIPDYMTNIPIGIVGFSNIRIEYLPEDNEVESIFNYRLYDEGQFKQECSYSFSLNWSDYGDDIMIQEAIDCEDRFYQMTYNKVYTVSQLMDRFSWQTFPQKAIEIKHVTENRCEGNYNPFPANDVYYRYDILFILFSFVLNVIILPIGIVVIIVLHVLAWLYGIFEDLYPAFCKLRNVVNRIKCKINDLIPGSGPFACEASINCDNVPPNPFKNLKLGVFLYTDDGCERCKCNVEGVPNLNSDIQTELQNYNQQFDNTSLLPDFTTTSTYNNPDINLTTQDGYLGFLQQVAAGAANEYFGQGVSDCYYLLPLVSDRADQKRIQFSTSLTLGERINLFNTKAKYFDNPGSLSPGSVGWNQIKVSWWPSINTTEEVVGGGEIISTIKSHYDNVMILLMEKDRLNVGEMITFQDPSLSNDPNVGFAKGELRQTADIIVRYACRNFGEGECHTVYTTRNNEATIADYSFPGDIEYLQVIHEIPLSAFTLSNYQSNGIASPGFDFDSQNNQIINTFGTLSDNMFSLPWRFLNSEFNSTSDISREGSLTLCDPSQLGYNRFYTQESSQSANTFNPVQTPYYLNLGRELFTNDFPIFNLNNEPSYQGVSYGAEANAFLRNTVVEYGYFTPATMLGQPPFQVVGDDNDFYGQPPVAWKYNTGKYGGIVGYSSDIIKSISDSNEYVVYILQRGVDPHSPKIPMKIDLSRLFGHQEYNANNGRLVIEGEFRMNIPIQAGESDSDPSGVLLPRHGFFTNNSSQTFEGRIYYRSYFFRPDSTGINAYSAYTTNMPLYYSALDINSIWNSGLWGNCTGPGPFYKINTETFDGQTPEFVRITPTNAMTGRFVPNTVLNPYTDNDTDTVECIPDYVSNSNATYGEFGKRVQNVYIPPNKWEAASLTRRYLGGYFESEYIEGASVMGMTFQTISPQGTGKFLGFRAQVSSTSIIDPPNPTTFLISDCGDCSYPKYKFDTNPYADNYGYFSPTYITSHPINDTDNPDALAWVNTAHTINMSNEDFIVFRTDRLPTSTTVTKNSRGNGYLLHQNNSFAIFSFGTGTTENTATQIGGYPIPEQANISEIDTNEIPVDDENVTNSLIECTSAVNLNSYGVDADGNPLIRPNDPYSAQGDKVYFRRDMGCYNFVSVPFKTIKGTPTESGGGGDIASLVEWVRRTTLNFSLCFEVWSHTFSNNWINGTLYAYPFQLATFFDANNEPTRDYCRHVVYFHQPNNTFYYRSSPWDGNDFIGKDNPNLIPGFSNKKYGNRKNLLYPTTLLDLGPKTNYLQELVYSDEYDGYIVSKIPTTSFQNITDLLNMFVLSRLVNTSFLQQLLPLNDSGNSEGADDPSVKGFFANTRWGNGQTFFNNLLPSVVDADYAQMLSINSEFGITEYGPELYTNNDVFFVNDNNSNSVFGILFQSNNQDRDYVSPRRTIWNDNSPFPPIPGDFTNISVNSQEVPLYQWRIQYQNNNTNFDPLQYPTIFGWQSNDFWTSSPDSAPDTLGGGTIFTSGFFYSKYQKLDRFDNISEYFKTDITNITKYYRGHIINFMSVTAEDGTITYEKTAKAPLLENRRYANTFGGPFHFYFGLIQGASAMDIFRTKYVDTNIIYE
jgi:hypothetical protein